jgi:hypothetical protein
MTVIIVCLVAYLAVTRKDVQRDKAAASRPRQDAPIAGRSRSLVVRVLLWLLLLLAAVVVFFSVGYLIGPHFISHVL